MKRLVCMIVLFLFVAVYDMAAQAEVVLWTSQNLHGYIKVYHNNRYVGQITRYSSTPPKPHTSGFVTLTISGPNNTFYAEAQDGTRWYSEKMTLQNGNYYTIRLYSNSSSHPKSLSSSSYGSGSSGSKSYSSSSGGKSYGSSSGSGSSSQRSYKNQMAYSTGSAVGSALGNAAYAASGVQMDGYPNLQAQAGWSSLFGEFIGLGTEVGGLGGAYLRGAISKDLFDGIKTSGVDGWDVRIGFYMGNEKNTFQFNVAITKAYCLPDVVGGLELGYARYFTDRFGLRAGSTFYVDDVSSREEKPLLEFNISLIYKLLSK